MGCISCKPANDDLSGSSEISGRLYIQNPYDQEPKRILPDRELFIQKDTSLTATSYLFSIKSDKDGYFRFQYLNDQFYKIHGELKTTTRLDTNVLFSVDSVQKPKKNAELILGPDFTNQNALYIICTDITPQAGRIPGDSIYIYTSRVLAENDTAAITGVGSAYRFVADVYGTAFKMNLPYGNTLYVNSACSFGNTRLRSQLDMIELQKVGIDTLYIRLR